MERKIKKIIMELCARVMGLPPEEAQAEFALTYFELTREGIKNPSFILLCTEVLSRNANETQKLLIAPDSYNEFIQESSVEQIIKLADEFEGGLFDLKTAFNEGDEAIKKLARASKGIDFKNLANSI